MKLKLLKRWKEKRQKRKADKDFDRRWKERFGPDRVKVMSAEETLKELKEMAEFE